MSGTTLSWAEAFLLFDGHLYVFDVYVVWKKSEIFIWGYQNMYGGVSVSIGSFSQSMVFPYINVNNFLVKCF